MSPTFDHCDKALVLRHYPKGWLKTGVVIISRVPEMENIETPVTPLGSPIVDQTLIIKRILAMPGDTITTHVSEIHEKIRDKYHATHDDKGEKTWHIPQSRYFLTGDSVGTDSRVWGPIPSENIKGIVVMKLRRKAHFQTTIIKSPLVEPQPHDRQSLNNIE